MVLHVVEFMNEITKQYCREREKNREKKIEREKSSQVKSRNTEKWDKRQEKKKNTKYMYTVLRKECQIEGENDVILTVWKI